MKTRILHTKIHFQDEWFNQLPSRFKYPFMYFISNSYIGHSGIYQVSDRVMTQEMNINKEELVEIKSFFEKEKKIYFHSNWVYVANAHKYYNPLKSELTKIALDKELSLIPKEIFDLFNNTVCIPYIYPIHTTINNKTLIINNNKENISTTNSEKYLEILQNFKKNLGRKYLIAMFLLLFGLLSLSKPVYAKTAVKLKITVKSPFAVSTVGRQTREIRSPAPSVHRTAIEEMICEVFEEECAIAIAIAKAESGLRCDAVGDGNTPYSSYGIFQIRGLPGRPSPEELTDCRFNIEYAHKLRHNWGNWTAWSVYTNKSYLNYL